VTESLTLYGFGFNDRSGKVRWTAHELGLRVEEKRLGLGEHRKPPYTDLNPFGFVPTAQWQGRTMIESTATCTWLAEQHPEAGLVVGPEEPQRYEYLQWMSSFAETTEAKLVEYLLSKYEMMDEHHARLNGPVLRRRMKVVVDRLPDGFLVADRFTLADILASYSLRLAVSSDLVPFDDVSHYLQPLMDRPAAKASRFFSSIEPDAT